MALKISICPLQAVGRYLDQVNEILAVLPQQEATGGIFQWPDTALPRTVVACSDLGCGEFYPDSLIKEIISHHPEMIAPTTEHVETIIAAGKKALYQGQDRSWRLLIHCHGGTSRSVAAAYIILALEDGPGEENKSYARLANLIHKHAAPDPNHNLVALADTALNRGGKLIQAHLDGIRLH